MIRCTRCIMPSSRPDTEFVDGVCSACLSFEARKTIDWEARLDALCNILSDAKPNGSGYDVIVPVSGGKDSYAQVKQLQDMGVKVLCVNATTCHLTPLGRRNLDNLKRHATVIEVSPHAETRRRLNKLGLQLVGDVSWPEHASIFTTPWRMAVALGIPIMVYGENPQREYGGPLHVVDDQQMTSRWVSEFGGFLGLRPDDFVAHGIPEEHLVDYRFPPREDVERVGVRAYFLGQFIPWDSRKNALTAQEMGLEYFYQHAWWPFENLDNAQTGLHDWFCFLKYGYGRVCAQASVDMRNGLMARDEAMQLAKHDAHRPEEFLGVRLTEVLRSIDVTREELTALEDKFRGVRPKWA